MTYMPRGERRAAILDAAMSIVLREGLAAATVRRVAQEIEIAAGQIHHHFASAAELRAEAFATLFRRFLSDRCTQHAGDKPVERLLALLGYSDDEADLAENRLLNEAMVIAQADDGMKAAFALSIEAWHREIVSIIQAGQKSGVFPRSSSTEDCALRLIGLSNGLYGMMQFQMPGFSKDVFNRHVRVAIDRELKPGRAGEAV